MEFRNQQDDEIGIPFSSEGYNSSPIRGSAFSKPTLPSSSSLVCPRGGGAGAVGAAGEAARNGGIFASTANPSPPPFNPSPSVVDLYPKHSLGKSSDPTPVSNASPIGAGAATVSSNSKHSCAAKTSTTASAAAADVSFRYRECLRNHAAPLGGHAVDGCGEFMPNGDPSTPEALKCAACGCHRSFHRKEVSGDSTNNAANSYYRGSSATRLHLLLPPPHPLVHQHSHHPHAKQFQLSGFPSSPSRTLPGSSGIVAFGNTSGSGGTTTESSSEERINAGSLTPTEVPKKRFRTKFTPEQKEKMLAFAEKVGWRIQKQDATLVEEFCVEVGVRKQALKVWMHNNMHTMRKQRDLQQDQKMQSSQHQQQ